LISFGLLLNRPLHGRRLIMPLFYCLSLLHQQIVALAWNLYNAEFDGQLFSVLRDLKTGWGHHWLCLPDHGKNLAAHFVLGSDLVAGLQALPQDHSKLRLLMGLVRSSN
jgi:hypothetical protein